MKRFSTAMLAAFGLALGASADSLPFELTVPKGWIAHPERLSPGQLGGMWIGPEGGGAYPPTIRVTVRNQSGTWDELKKSIDDSLARQAGAKVVSRTETQRFGHSFLTYHLKISGSGELIEGVNVIFADAATACVFTGLTQESDWKTNGPAIEAAAESFRPSP